MGTRSLWQPQDVAALCFVVPVSEAPAAGRRALLREARRIEAWRDVHGDIAQTDKLVRAVNRCVLLRLPPPGNSDECRLLGKRETESGRDAARDGASPPRFQRGGSSLEDAAPPQDQPNQKP